MTWTLSKLKKSLSVAAAVLTTCATADVRPAAAQAIDPIVIYAGDTSTEAGLMARASSTTGAGGLKITSPDTGWDALGAPLAQPAHYIEATFDAVAGVRYHVWLRLRAAANSKWNDSVWVQFDQSIDAANGPLWRIGSTSGLLVNLEDCIGCGVSGWGWQDNASWTGQSAVVSFATGGPQRIRIQLREDGVDLDQVVLSSTAFAAAAPGATRDDTTIVPKPDGGGTPARTLTRQPFLQQVTERSAVVVFATAGRGQAAVRVTDAAGSSRLVAAQTTTVTSDISGGAPYYQHEAIITDLAAAGRYSYDPLVDGVDLTSGTDTFATAPAIGDGSVRFLAFGDSGVGSAAQRQLAARMAGERFDLLLHTGDVAYGFEAGYGAGAMPQLQAWFFDVYRDLLRTHPVYPSIGNHDDEPQHARPYRSAFVLPVNGADTIYPDHAERYYSFDYGAAHVVVLDTEYAFQDVSRREAQLAWLNRDLAATSQPWKIAVFHRSPYSAGGEHGSDVLVQSTFEPVFARFGVSLVLSGHEHTYERTLPQQAGNGLGITYIVTGGGGAPLYPSATAAWTAASASVHHFLRGTIDRCRLAVEAVGLDGRVFDSTTLQRCGGSTPFGGQPAMLPGVIEAEAFDAGGEGVAYHDLTSANEGGAVRNEGVDLEPATDAGGGYNVGWLWPGEWLTYTVTTPVAAAFDLFARVSSPGQGGTFTVSVDGVRVPGTFQVPATGGWQAWQTVGGPRVALSAGVHQLRFDMQASGVEGGAIGNINSFTAVSRSSDVSVAPASAP